MTPVFGHGRLRLYLLKLLDESPRHGYEIIRLLQDRFLGLYAPSAGTVYPRLAKLEQEGLVAHSVEGGRKVYRITDAGRAELTARQAELDALEAEIRESVYERAREIRDEVRTSARNLREELRQAAQDVHETPRPRASSSAKGWGGAGAGGREDPVSAWAKNLGPALSQKMVDLAEGLAQGLAGLTEQRTQRLEDEILKHFGPDPLATERPDVWGAETDAEGAAKDTTSGSDHIRGAAAKSRLADEDVEVPVTSRPAREKSRRARPGAEELGALFDRFRHEIDAVAARAGLTPTQVDRARDVVVQACADLKDILNERH
ncbi:PadR family transcriptional regulator [Yinghuangia seranimata]|uniref:PadR family transcriptional regulator n=1 Tax=Yinghuangia seranimata TaxID=408067 RepID=UPI00248C55F7|nr:PadR family transcriptional regulator [Yinghuangia seranimata]MDI2131508.1 PadR family transcriptional regulator [Yinghuangia seranimata]